MGDEQPPPPAAPEETLEALQARHRREQRDLQGRVTNKKKNATKKTRRGVNDECAALERQLRERHDRELAALRGEAPDDQDGDGGVDETNGLARDEDPADAVAARLKDAHLATPSQPLTATPPPPQPGAAGGEGGGGAGKKRNRQKERLARRAAEQEAAAEAAEQEAAGMTDHRKVEKTYLLREFEAHGLAEKEIRPDGHCLFAAIADQLEQRGIPLLAPSSSGEEGEGEDARPPPYRTVRRRATEYMEAHPDDFAPFLEEPLEKYVPRIRDTAEWGGQLELAALAAAYSVEIAVVQDGRTETIEPPAAAPGKAGGGERERLWLAYYRHGYGLGEHYNSLRKKQG